MSLLLALFGPGQRRGRCRLIGVKADIPITRASPSLVLRCKFPMHPFNAELRRREEFGKPVEIGSDVWAGGGAIILPGVKIGSRAVIGAASVVTGDVPEGVFAAGNPYRVIREINE
jgi:acetyltransferase-like isoleucine patch superfamily enzyme